MRWVLGLMVAGFVMGGGSPAFAVTNLTVTTPTSAATGARTDYIVSFTNGGQLTGTNNQIFVTFPAGTGFAGYNTSSVKLGTTTVGSCGGANGTAVTCTLFGGQTIAAGAAVQVTFGGITNGPAGTGKVVSVSTSTDTVVNSAGFDIVANHPVTSVTATNTPPSAAAAARTEYTVGFTTSPSGGLSSAANSTITVTFPSGTTFGAYNTAAVTVGTDTVGSCGGASGLNISCTLFSGRVIAPSTAVQLVFGGITNSSTVGAKTVDVATTSDTAGTSGSFSVLAAQQISQPAVDIGAPSAAEGARTQYVIGFTTSSTGGLSSDGNSAITVTFPSGTTFGAYNTAAIKVGTTAVGSCGGASGVVVTCTLFSGRSIAPSTMVQIVFGGITNSVAGAKTLSVSTTSDPAAVSSATFTVLAAQQISQPAVSIGAPSAAEGARTQYVIGFTTSSTGGLSSDGNSAITVTFPSGTTFGAYNTAAIKVGTTAVGSCGGASGVVVTCTLFSGRSIAPSTMVQIVFGGITNSVAGAKTLSVSTTSDPQAVASASFSVVANNPVTRVRVQVGSLAASAATQYVVTFATSATGGLSAAGNSAITLTFPAGTGFTGYSSGIVAAGGTNIGSCGGASGLSITCTLFGGREIPATGGVQITLTNITNPAGGPPYTLTSTTTSDPTAVASAPYAITGAPDTTILSGPSGTINDSTPTFTYSSNDPAATFECRVDSGLFVACGSEYTTPALIDGPHTFEVRATGAGGVDPSPATRSFTVATAAPDTSITAGPSGTTGDTTPTFTFTATEPGATFECRVDAAAFKSCTSPFTTDPLVDGSHTFDVRAIGIAGTDQTPASRSFTVAAPVATIDGAPTAPTSTPSFTFSSNQPGALFECRIDAAPFQPCSSPYSPGPLTAGAHTFEVRAIGGPAASRSFTVAAPQPANPAPTPSATPTPTPTPVPGKTVVVQVVSGKVLVKKPGSNQFVEVDASQGIPLGSTVDTKAGAVELTAKAGQKATFSDGIFKVTQSGGTTDLTLTEPLAPCGRARAAAKKPKSRKLWGDGSGSFRTRGQYSAATVRGTRWLVQDSCAGTLTKVTKGVVSVRDNVKRKTILVKAGKQYLAKPRR